MNQKNKELKKVNAELDRFVYSASHEIRSPLSSILGIVNIARTDNKTDRNFYFDYIEVAVWIDQCNVDVSFRRSIFWIVVVNFDVRQHSDIFRKNK